MSVRRHLVVSVIGSMLGFGLLFACATNVELGTEQIPEPDAGPGTVIPEAGATGDDAAADAPADVAFDGSVTGACSPGGFCYLPVPIQTPLVAVSGSSPNDAWTVGGSTILRHRGTEWELVYGYSGTSPTSITFWGIWARSPENVWAIASTSSGGSMIVRYASLDGGTPRFSEITTTATGSSSWVTPSSDALWMANGSGTITRLSDDGSGDLIRDDHVPKASDTDSKSYFWTSVWGFGPDDVYASGQDFSFFGGTNPPMLAHYDGKSWTITLQSVPVGSSAASLGGTVSGEPQQLWSSTSENSASGPILTASLYPIEDGAIGNVLLQQKATTLSPCGSKYVWATSPTSAWMSNGKIVCRWDGTKLERVPTAVGGLPTGFVRGIWAANEDDVWIVGEAVPQGAGFPTMGFAARRTKDSGASQP